jgi:hypothetical protein
MSEPQHRRLARWLNVFGAVLIVIGSIGVVFSVIRSSHSPSYPLASSAEGAQHTSGAPTRTADSAVADADGLRVAMILTPGPYFLGELVVADLSLTNSSAMTYLLANGCGGVDEGAVFGGTLYEGVVHVTISGGIGPHLSLPTANDSWCPAGQTTLKPGQVLTSHLLLLIPNSGKIIMKPGAWFYQTHTGPDGVPVTSPAAHSPLDGHWPSLTLSVAPVAPMDRRITLQRTGTTVQVQAPLSARSSLYDIYTLKCSNPINDPQAASAEDDTIAGWEPLAGTVLREPVCGEGEDPAVRFSTIHWSYAVGAPGFTIAVGEQG